MLKKILANKFIKNVSILAGGTALAQALTILVLPILTRLYSPNDFEVFAIYSSIFGILSVVVCLRFEIAIPIPKDYLDALCLVVLSILSTLITVLIVSITTYLFYEQINKWTDSKLTTYLWFLPFSLVLFGLYTSFQYWATRKKDFSKIAKTRMVQSVSASTAQIGLGFYSLSAFGLLLGHLIQVGAGVVSLGVFFTKDIKRHLNEISLSSLKETFKKYDRFPKYSTWEALTNSAAIHVPILIIAAHSIGPEAGYIMLAMRLLSVPMGLIGGAVAQVYLSEAAERHHQGSLRVFTLQTLTMLLKVGLLPILLVAIASPFLIPIVFGEDWHRVGLLITWMAPWFLAQFVVSPISMALHITENQKIAFVLQLTGLVIRVGSVFFATFFFKAFIGEIYAISGLVFYLVYIWVILKILSKS